MSKDTETIAAMIVRLIELQREIDDLHASLSWREAQLKYWYKGFGSHEGFVYDNPEADSWFDPETGEPRGR